MFFGRKAFVRYGYGKMEETLYFIKYADMKYKSNIKNISMQKI